jgi:hypothetical protein
MAASKCAGGLLPGVPLVESPLFALAVEEAALSGPERAIAEDLHRSGFAVIDFPDPEIDARIERIKTCFAPSFGIDPGNRESRKGGGNKRLQDAWRDNADVRAIAANPSVLGLLGKLWGRRAIPFQTLNFPVGTQQHPHSDAVHFSSIPERFMCGVWLAMEDVHPDAGPLCYVPGSHRWPIPSNLMMGRHAGQPGDEPSAQSPFEELWEAMTETSGTAPELFLAKKGQALIWCANLLHGGSRQVDMTLTRWSQVTHYYFDDCIYYTPAYSDEALGRLATRQIVDIATGENVPNRYLGEPLDRDTPQPRKRLLDRFRRAHTGTASAPGLPDDFDAARYHELHPDVADSGEDAVAHYIKHGRNEGRRYR